MGAVGLYSRGRGPNGHRLANPRDPIVRQALERTCPVCNVEPGVWCVGVAEGKTNGRQRSRLHFDRCKFVEVPA
ncbi:hypothetical protein SEA_CAMBIARE_39 [Mycobacterium phage Cambiare]|uniref:Uncharacterized protein n=1 Tax=Mycobacterium phage Cambiare TaxID=1647305 RepID=A0A0F6WE44_9CAUD|nr:hypothetical protein AVT48_gp39 [Mycobacterium phage Cambiare]AKF14541.1 hypothetical protein SEA_CAMBIARE_39 [Mycobacterium phage Cambiare]